MNRLIFTALLTIGSILITLYSEWWLIVLYCGVLSYFYNASLIEKTAIVKSILTTIWLGIAGYQEAMVIERASSMIGKIFGNIAPSLIYTITALVITIPSIMATGLGHSLRKIISVQA